MTYEEEQIVRAKREGYVRGLLEYGWEPEAAERVARARYPLMRPNESTVIASVPIDRVEDGIMLTASPHIGLIFSRLDLENMIRFIDTPEVPE